LADDDIKFRNRLLTVTAVRFAGLAIAGFGIAVFYSDLLREGGWPQLGAALVVVGVVDSTFAPMLLRRAWDREDRGEQ